MIPFLSWYVLITLLGWLTFPLAYYLFPALSDRGYPFARAFGLLIWAYIFWLFASLGVAQNDIGGLLLGLVILGGLSAWAFMRCREEIRDWVGQNRSPQTRKVRFIMVPMTTRCLTVYRAKACCPKAVW